MNLNKMNRRMQFQTQIILVALFLCAYCQSFKLPVNLRKSAEPWPRTQLQSENVDGNVSSDINSVSTSPGKSLKFPDGSEISDFNLKSKNDDNDNSLPYFPVVVFNRNGFLDSKYVGDISSEHGAKPHLQRFYKHVMNAKTTQSNQEMIVFPGQERPASESETSNEKDSKDYLRFSSRTPETSSEMETENPEQLAILYEPEKSSSNNKTDNQEASRQSLESLAQIVRHLLFRVTEPVPAEETTESSGQLNTKMDVSDQALYTGPKVKPNSNDDGCSDGQKKTRNGSCQKPSRRLGTG